MSHRHRYVTHPEVYSAYYAGAPVRPMVFYQDDGTWRSGYTLQRGRVQYRNSDLSLRANRGEVIIQPSSERPINRVVPQQQQQYLQQQYQQQQYQQQQQQYQQQKRDAYIKQVNKARAKSSSPVRGEMSTDKMFAFNSLRKEMKDGLSGLKHVTMDIPKLNQKAAPTICYNEMQRTINAMENEARKWRHDLDSIYGRKSAPSTPRSRSNDEIMSELQKQMSTAERKTVEAEEANSKYEILSAECRDLKNTVERLEAEKEAMAREKNEANTTEPKIVEAEEANKKYELLSAECRELKHVIERLETEKEVLTREKNEADTRLSEIAGSKLLSGNTNIADLSTENRPTKIAEKFRELYDNEWTEVIEILGKDDPVEEKKVIAMLLYIVKESYAFCTSEVEELCDRLKSTLLSPDGQGSTGNVSVGREGEDLVTQLIKATAEQIQSRVVKKFLSSLENDEGLEQPLVESVKSFAHKCCEITWLMTVQSPSMYIDCDVRTGTSFNSDLMMQYTRSGPKVEFVVWPVVYIEKNGALLTKGVVQPTKND